MYFVFLLAFLMFDPLLADSDCEPCEDWTQYIDADDPDGEGDLEKLSDLVTMSPRLVCSNPTRMDVQLVDDKQCSSANQVVDRTDGFACYNGENDDICCDYKARFCCPGLDLCDRNPGICQNGATCVGNAASYHCVCAPKFTGSHCEVEDFCTSMPCLNGGSCANNTCSCTYWYTGETCQIELDYKLTTTAMSWIDARSFCQSTGGDLAAWQMRNATIRESIFAELNGDYYWIGLSDLDVEGVWKWVDGVASTDNTIFHTDEPNDIGSRGSNADCATLDYRNFVYLVDDDNCIVDRLAICEQPM